MKLHCFRVYAIGDKDTWNAGFGRMKRENCHPLIDKTFNVSKRNLEDRQYLSMISLVPVYSNYGRKFYRNHQIKF